MSDFPETTDLMVRWGVMYPSGSTSSLLYLTKKEAKEAVDRNDAAGVILFIGIPRLGNADQGAQE